ncbi:hypothetical protein CEV33_2752 [Brucella grignonensis]|uniref:Uncharacterized protein n=1 Tax=Brucella grignonensis TaxID=94627 RepID=A0A256F2G1_9HYPH|nr:hypothetical protein CEV33_2752 [Brucella grignonensis]
MCPTLSPCEFLFSPKAEIAALSDAKISEVIDSVSRTGFAICGLRGF